MVLLIVGAGVTPRRGVVLQAPDSSPARAAMRTRWLVSAVTILIGLACIFAAAYPLAADQAIASSQNAVNAGKTAAAISDARNAVAVESGSAAAQLQLAESLSYAGQYRAAVAAARAATLAEPQGWSNWYVLGRLYADLGRDSAAESACMRARSLNPFDASAYMRGRSLDPQLYPQPSVFQPGECRAPLCPNAF